MDIVSLGEILIDLFPVEVGRKLAEVSAFYPKPGGASANVAVAAARLGKKSAFIGKVGDDAFGHMLIETLKQNKVETRGMRVDEKNRTTLTFIAMPDENSAEFIFYRNPGADLCLRADELDHYLLENTKALHCGSLTLVDEPARSAQYNAVEMAQNKGALISFDVNHRPKLWSDHAEALKQIWRMYSLTDLLKVNETELELLTGSSDPSSGGLELVRKGVKLVAITLGTKGSYFSSTKYQGYIPPFVVKTVDAIGCGDAFISGLITALLDASGGDLDLDEATLVKSFTYANAVGAITALSRGVIPALPTAAQVTDFIKNYKR
jgi:fructokinase